MEVKKLIEYAYAQNDNTPVTLISHSMGGLMSLVLLQQVDATWKDQYISKVISLAGTWGGTVVTLEAYTVGYDLGSWVIPKSSMKTIQRSFPSIAWLMPSEYFWKKDEILVQTAKKQYNVTNYDEFFQ